MGKPREEFRSPGKYVPRAYMGNDFFRKKSKKTFNKQYRKRKSPVREQSHQLYKNQHGLKKFTHYERSDSTQKFENSGKYSGSKYPQFSRKNSRSVRTAATSDRLNSSTVPHVFEERIYDTYVQFKHN